MIRRSSQLFLLRGLLLLPFRMAHSKLQYTEYSILRALSFRPNHNTLENKWMNPNELVSYHWQIKNVTRTINNLIAFILNTNKFKWEKSYQMKKIARVCNSSDYWLESAWIVSCFNHIATLNSDNKKTTCSMHCEFIFHDQSKC